MIRFLVYPTGNILTKWKLLLKAPQSTAQQQLDPLLQILFRILFFPGGHFKKA